MNPLLATAEYGSSPRGYVGKSETMKDRRMGSRSPGSKSCNPLLMMPEYEGELSAARITKNSPKKRKFDKSSKYGLPLKNREIEFSKKSFKKDDSGSKEHNGNSRGLAHFEKSSEKGKFRPVGNASDPGTSNLTDRNFQSRCLTTFSRNKMQGEEPANLRNPKYEVGRKFEKANNEVGAGKHNGYRGFIEDRQKRKLNKKWHGDTHDRGSVSNKKKKKKRKEAGPWGLSSLLQESQLEGETKESLSLEGMGCFTWNATPQDFAKLVSNSNEFAEVESEDSEDEPVVKEKKKLTPAERRAIALEEEKNLKKKERELLESEDNPQSPDHFERLLLGSPNSAELWIKYIGHHAVNADIEKARVVAQRAIKRIDPQLTSAKLDVWIALLNLDFTFSPPDVFRETVSEAARCNDDHAIYSRVLNLYAEAKNVSEVDQLANKMVRKYPDKLDNWLQCQNVFMMVGQPDKARHMLQKALAVLNKKDHVTLISRFALLENKYGFSEQAEALFENLLTSFPQRVDLLSVYVDMLVKSNRVDFARSVLERASNNHLPVRKMKTIYTKWIAFEEVHGTPSDVVKVEEAAQKYVSDLLKPHAKSTNDNDPHRNVGSKSEKMVHDDTDSSDEEEAVEDGASSDASV